MTVKELIAQLSRYEENALVVTGTEGNYNDGKIISVISEHQDKLVVIVHDEEIEPTKFEQ